jgi:hypothetical protein
LSEASDTHKVEDDGHISAGCHGEEEPNLDNITSILDHFIRDWNASYLNRASEVALCFVEFCIRSDKSVLEALLGQTGFVLRLPDLRPKFGDDQDNG